MRAVCGWRCRRGGIERGRLVLTHRRRNALDAPVVGAIFVLALTGCTSAAEPAEKKGRDSRCIPLEDADHWVDAGAPSGGDGTQGHPFQTIQAGADAGGVVSIAPGTYAETVVMGEDHDGISLIAPCGGATVDATGLGDRTGAIDFDHVHGKLTLDGLTVTGGHGGGVMMRAGVATLRNIVALDNRFIGVALSGAHSRIVVENVTVRDTEPVTDAAAGMVIDAGATVEGTGVTISGGTGLGLSIYQASTNVDLTDVDISGAATTESGIGGDGVQVSQGAHVTLRSANIHDNAQHGVMAGETNTELTIEDSEITDNTQDAWVRENVAVTGGATLRLNRVWIRRGHGFGMQAGGAGSTIEMHHGGVLDTLPYGAVEDYSAGAFFFPGSIGILDGVEIGRNAGFGLVSNGADVTVGFSSIHDTSVRGADSGEGAIVDEHGILRVSDCLIADNDTAAVAANAFGQAIITDTELRGTRANEYRSGCGIWAGQDSVVSATDTVITDNEGYGILVYNRAAVMGDGLVIDRTLRSPTVAGAGAAVTEGGYLRLARSRVSGAATTGVITYGVGARIEMVDSVISEQDGVDITAGGVPFEVALGATGSLRNVVIDGGYGSGILLGGYDTFVTADNVEVRNIEISPFQSSAVGVQVQRQATLDAQNLRVHDIAGPGVVNASAYLRCIDCSALDVGFAGFGLLGTSTLSGCEVAGVGADDTLGGGVSLFVDTAGTVTVSGCDLGEAPLAAAWIQGGGRPEIADSNLEAASGAALRGDLILHGNAVFVTGGAAPVLNSNTFASGPGPTVLLAGATATFTGNVWEGNSLGVLQQSCDALTLPPTGWEAAPTADLCPEHDVSTLPLEYTSQPLERAAAEE